MTSRNRALKKCNKRAGSTVSGRRQREEHFASPARTVLPLSLFKNPNVKFVDIFLISPYNVRTSAMMGRSPQEAIKESAATAESSALSDGRDNPEPPARAGAFLRYGKKAEGPTSFKLGGTAKRTSSHALCVGVFFYRRVYILCSHRHPKAQRICCLRTHTNGNM